MSTKMITIGSALAAGAIGLTACSSTPAAHRSPSPAQRPSAARHQMSSAPHQPAAAGNFCAAAKKATAVITALSGGDPDKIDPVTFEREVNGLVAAAPAVVKADVQSIADVELAVVKHSPDAQTKLQDAAFIRHVAHFAAWMQPQCPGVVDAPTNLPAG